MSLELDDDDDDAFASVDVDAVVAALRASSDANATTSTARETDRSSDASGARTAARASARVDRRRLRVARARVSCSRTPARGIRGETRECAGMISRGGARPRRRIKTRGRVGTPLTRLMEVYVALCAMDAFEIVRGVGSSRCRKRGVPPVTTIEYLSRAPGFRGATRPKPRRRRDDDG